MQTWYRYPEAMGKKRIITGCVNRDRRQQRVAGSSGVFPVGLSWIYSRVIIKIFMDDITACPGNIKECVQHIQICQFKQMPKTTPVERRESIFLTYCRIISLQWSLLCSLTEVFSDHFDWPSFHLQGITPHDYHHCIPRISLSSSPTPMRGSSGCLVLLRAPFA